MRQLDAIKNLDQAYPIPTEWRSTFTEIVQSFVRRDYAISSKIRDVEPVSDNTAAQILDYIDGYGETLLALPEDSWQTSVAQWMDGYWDVLIDLWTVAEGPSDLVLGARVTESAGGYKFKVGMVYVP